MIPIDILSHQVYAQNTQVILVVENQYQDVKSGWSLEQVVQTEEKNTVPTDVCYALIHDKKTNSVLVVQNEHGGWSFPGGAKESSETLYEALIREVKEETGLDIEVIGEIETTERHSPTHDIFHLFYVVLKDDAAYGEVIFPSDEDIIDSGWIPFENVRIYLPWYENGIAHLKDKITNP